MSTLKGLKAPSRRFRRTVTAREQRQEILSRLDTLTQAISQAKARASDDLATANALAAALASTRAAQRHMESINE